MLAGLEILSLDGFQSRSTGCEYLENKPMRKKGPSGTSPHLRSRCGKKETMSGGHLRLMGHHFRKQMGCTAPCSAARLHVLGAESGRPQIFPRDK